MRDRIAAHENMSVVADLISCM